MKLIVGLGNPGAEYNQTRHNVGANALDTYVSGHGGVLQQKSKYKSLMTELTIDGQKVITIIPTTYYNSSGEAVQAVASFYKIEPSDILIVHDELSLPFGTVRIRYGGSDAGNNGVKSVTSHIGPDTARIRVGVYNELRDRIADADFVLSRFTAQENDAFREIMPIIHTTIDSFVAGTLSHTTSTIEKPSSSS
ncbi:MAG: aminoacyl-tRNA hydrolase [Candidatus Saccharimonadales bacterium]